MFDDKYIEQACREIAMFARNRKSVLVFCASVKRAERTSGVLKKVQEGTVEMIDGSTLPDFRAEYINAFKQGQLKYLVNVDVLTTGFDAPNVDMIVLLRPTASPGLYYQMIGRSRPFDGRI